MTIEEQEKPNRPINPFWKALLEVGFIVFLFYSNLLMGEYTHSGMGYKNGIIWAMRDIFSQTNFSIAILAALIGYFVFDFLRKRV